VSATGAPRPGLVLTTFAGGLAVVFAATFGLGGAVPPVDPAAPLPAATVPAASHPGPAAPAPTATTDHPPMTGMSGTGMSPG
jgi:hypothetical protein